MREPQPSAVGTHDGLCMAGPSHSRNDPLILLCECHACQLAGLGPLSFPFLTFTPPPLIPHHPWPEKAGLDRPHPTPQSSHLMSIPLLPTPHSPTLHQVWRSRSGLLPECAPPPPFRTHTHSHSPLAHAASGSAVPVWPSPGVCQSTCHSLRGPNGTRCRSSTRRASGCHCSRCSSSKMASSRCSKKLVSSKHSSS